MILVFSNQSGRVRTVGLEKGAWEHLVEGHSFLLLR